jgi:hypothetical protein
MSAQQRPPRTDRLSFAALAARILEMPGPGTRLVAIDGCGARAQEAHPVSLSCATLKLSSGQGENPDRR